MTEREEWRATVGYEGYYEVSDRGRVRSLDHVVIDSLGRVCPRRGRILQDRPRASGHLVAALHVEGARYDVGVHRLVLEAFVGPCPEGMEGCHNDGDPTNNCVENLRWDTRSENLYDAVKHGANHWAKRTHCKNGHEYSQENTFWTKAGSRICLECRRFAGRNYVKKIRDARKVASIERVSA